MSDSTEWKHEDDVLPTVKPVDDSESLINDALIMAAEEKFETSVNTGRATALYSRAQIEEMKIRGVPKPADVSWGDWVGPKDLSHRHDYFIHLAATGITNNEIADIIGMTPARVSILVNNTEIKNKIKALQDQVWGGDSQRRFKHILNKAITKAEKIMDNTTKDQLAAEIAFRFMDRALGKPKQEVTVEGNLLADFMHRLDQKETRQVSETTLHSKPKDDVDEFIANFVPENFTIGKRTGGYE